MIDIGKLSKQELLDRAKWKCPLKGHSCHNGLEHPRCYDKMHKIVTNKVGILDIETEDLNGDYGVVFCWCLLDVNTDKIFADTIILEDIKKYTSKEKNIQPKEDSRIIQTLINALLDYQLIVTHYGSRFDLNFIRTRALICGLDFPGYGLIYQRDTWMILKNKFKLRRNTLENASLKLLGQTRKDHLSLSVKHGCLRGEPWALNITLKHCENDVLDTRDLYNSINKFTKQSKTSI